MGDFNAATNSIVWPWEAEFGREMEIYEKVMRERFGNFSQHNMREITGTVPWEQKKKTKAAFYASFDNSRWVIMEVAARHPDLFDFAMNDPYMLFCWRSDCKEQGWQPHDYPRLKAEALRSEPTLPGYKLLNYTHHEPVHYNPGHFKYVVVPLGEFLNLFLQRLLFSSCSF